MQLKTVVLYGSVRTERQGIKAARFIEKKLKERNRHVTLIDPIEYKLPLIEKRYREYKDPPALMKKLADILIEADGYILVSGEYNHSIPPALKNMIDHYKDEYVRKVAGVMTYSGGPFGGVRVSVHLRAILGELGMVTVPMMMPIPSVQDAFDDTGTPNDEAYHQRAEKFISEFEWYVEALKHQREKRPLLK